ncbi:hypothetical protein [Bowmanella denitrificans]|uniref:hypothetical protein n=1 Tax=Bowmanella denitrificans TaxID=366582 RepID=UPI000C9B8955|nr:hypothetical protein [Bowmanella denitrificans]
MLSRFSGPLWLLVFFSSGLKADLLTDANFYFGRIAITNNSIVSTTTVPVNGNQTSTNHILVIEPGQPGVYTLTDLPPFANVSVSADVPAFSSSPLPGTEQFTITAVDIPSTLKADATGSVQFKMGGTIATSGTGGSYVSPADYMIVININITY